MTHFQLRRLCAASYAAGWTLWQYSLPGPLSDAFTKDYFSDAKTIISDGDTILICGKDASGIFMVKKEEESFRLNDFVAKSLIL